jgi:hypothetical protein
MSGDPLLAIVAKPWPPYQATVYVSGLILK